MPAKSRPPSLDGILVIDKPQGKTSHDVVETVRRLVGFRQIGHLGTLDPLATGVLVLALGRATRLARFYADRRKRYACAVRFGFATDTYDADGAALSEDSRPQLDACDLQSLAARFIGAIEQVPPSFSAKKIHGRPAHELARKHKPVHLEPVAVNVYKFELTAIEASTARFTVECGSGTYIRSLAHDMGKLHGAGAHLSEIQRTAVGEFTLEDAVSLEQLAGEASRGEIAARVIPLSGLLLELPRAAVFPVIERRIRHGARFNLPLSQVQPGFAPSQPAPPLDSDAWKPARLRVFSQTGELVAIAEAVAPRTYQPIVVLETSSPP